MIYLINTLPDYIFSKKFDFFYFCDSAVLADGNVNELWEAFLDLIEERGDTNGYMSWLVQFGPPYPALSEKEWDKIYRTEYNFSVRESWASITNKFVAVAIEDVWRYMYPLFSNQSGTWVGYQVNPELVIFGVCESIMAEFTRIVLEKENVYPHLIQSFEELSTDYYLRKDIEDQLLTNFPMGPFLRK